MPRRLMMLLSIFAAGLLLLAACGSGDGDPIVVAGQSEDDPVPPTELDPVDTPLPDGPIPVEPDGGIGDGAGPPPFAQDEPAPEGDWHGEQVPVTNCPGTDWMRVQAAKFSFSVPVGFTEQDVQPVDSEVAVWTTGVMELTFDYGWYSGELGAEEGPVDTLPIDYSGIAGDMVVATADNTYSGRNYVGVHFPQVEQIDGQTDRLTFLTYFDDPADEIIARCIAGSIDWDL